jgi:Zn2+/Cd2+-exporting ATPase
MAIASPSPSEPSTPPRVGHTRSRIRIEQMDCPTEETLIRKRLGAMAEVERLDVDLVRRVLTVVHADAALPQVEAAIRSLGMTPAPVEENPSTAPPPSERFGLLVTAVLLALGAEAADWLDAPALVAPALALAAIALAGLGTYRKGWIALRHGDLNINALMSIAVTGALLIGEWPEAAMVMVLFTVAERIEARSLDRARRAIGDLLRAAPEHATVRAPDGTWMTVVAADVPLGSRVRVRPGERIALDGEVVAGRSSVDQSAITGESLPVEKTAGDPVFAGTLNASGSFEFRVTAEAGNTTLARIVHAVEEAQVTRAPTQRFVDRFARVYTPAVVVVALVVAVAPPLLGGGAWLEWVYRALVLLVIACPCALVISTPVTIVSGLAAATRHGLLVKGGAFLERGRDLTTLALDKTGTLTHGTPTQTDVVTSPSVDPGVARRLATILAARSDHPVSRAVAQAGERADETPAEVVDFEALAGSGVEGTIDGVRYALVSRRSWVGGDGLPAGLDAQLDAWERQGKTTLVLGDDRRILAAFAVADTIRASSRAAVAELHALGVRTLMLSGDNPHAVAAIAAEAGIDEAHGGLLPQAKADAVAARRDAGRHGGVRHGRGHHGGGHHGRGHHGGGHHGRGGLVGMVGDGINDAPALAAADIGFAMGAAGSDTAIETADVALMDDDLRKVPRFIRLSRATHGILVQNIVLALGIKAVFLGLTLVGLATMWMAVFADMGTSLLVVVNGLRLLNHGRRWRRT